MSFFNFLFSTPVVYVDKRNDVLYNRLQVISQIDMIEKVFREQSIHVPISEIDHIFKVKSEVLEICLSSQVDDVRKQFKEWSQNVKEYDCIRRRLVNTA